MGRMKNAIDEYEKRFYPDKKGSFKLSDIHEVVDLSTSEEGSIGIFRLCYNAQRAAFVIGYRCRKREEAQKRKQQITIGG